MRTENVRLIPIFLTALGFLLLAAAAGAQSPSVMVGTEGKFAVLAPNHDDDLKFYLGDGRIVKGLEALGRMQAEADVTLWLAATSSSRWMMSSTPFKNKIPERRSGSSRCRPV